MKAKQYQPTKPTYTQSKLDITLLFSDDHDEKYQEFLKLEKNIDIDAIKHNVDRITN